MSCLITPTLGLSLQFWLNGWHVSLLSPSCLEAGPPQTSHVDFLWSCDFSIFDGWLQYVRMWNAKCLPRKELLFAVKELGSISASAVILQTQKRIWDQQCKHCKLQCKPCCYWDGRSSRGETEVTLISFWQSQQTVILLCQRKVALLACREPLILSAHVYVLHTVWEQIKKESVLSWAPPSTCCIKAALFRELG